MTDSNQPIVYPVLIRFGKTDLMRFVGHLDWQALQLALFLRAGLSIAISDSPTRRLKLKTSPPTPVGVACRTELTYLPLTERIYPQEAARRLQEQCPDGVDIISVRDAGQLPGKNPFRTIEASAYILDLSGGISDSHIEAIQATHIEALQATLEKIRTDPPPDGIEPDRVKQFWGRIIEMELDNKSIRLLALQKEGETFHAARCATFLQENLGLPHYPLFTKLDYYRLKPSKRRLFR